MKKLPFVVLVLLIALIVWAGSYAYKVYRITQAKVIPVYEGKIIK